MTRDNLFVSDTGLYNGVHWQYTLPNLEEVQAQIMDR
jgi:hypothetical protein